MTLNTAHDSGLDPVAEEKNIRTFQDNFNMGYPLYNSSINAYSKLSNHVFI